MRWRVARRLLGAESPCGLAGKLAGTGVLAARRLLHFHFHFQEGRVSGGGGSR